MFEDWCKCTTASNKQKSLGKQIRNTDILLNFLLLLFLCTILSCFGSDKTLGQIRLIQIHNTIPGNISRIDGVALWLILSSL